MDHDSLTAVKPDIITLSCTAYGHTGPWQAYGARARTVDAACGLSYLTGYEGGPSLRASANYMDHTGGLNVAYALLLALYRKRKTGQGARIDLSMYETGVSCIAPAVLEAQRGVSRPRLGPSHLWKAPHNVYPCLGDDRWIAITVSDDDEWRSLRRAMGEPDWAGDASLDTEEGRHADRQSLDAHIAQWTAETRLPRAFPPAPVPWRALRPRQHRQGPGVRRTPVAARLLRGLRQPELPEGRAESVRRPPLPCARHTALTGPRVLARPAQPECVARYGRTYRRGDSQRLVDEGVLSTRPRVLDRPPADPSAMAWRRGTTPRLQAARGSGDGRRANVGAVREPPADGKTR